MNEKNVPVQPCNHFRTLSQEEITKLEKQNSRMVTSFRANKLEMEAKKNWDLFYKRNTTNFFKDRHWSMREFQDLLGEKSQLAGGRNVLLEVGCGVGNFVFPLIEQKLNLFVYACDFSCRAVQLVKENELYDENHILVFQCDLTQDKLTNTVKSESVDIISMIFVLSAIHPEKFIPVLRNMYHVLKPGGIVIFRDYGLHDMAQLRFGPGSKISENFYVRQDGTRSYYFSPSELTSLFTKAGYEVVNCNIVHRRTVNKKEGIDVPRVFVQGKFAKLKGKK